MYLHRLLTLLIASTLLAACGGRGVKPEPPPLEKVPVVEEKPLPPAKPEIEMRKPRAKPQVVILLSQRIPAYQQVADELEKRLPGSITLISLDSAKGNRKQLTKLLKSKEYQQFVAIGLEAANYSGKVAGREDEVVFCQVFNYEKYKLVGPRSKGVGALPGTAELFATWSAISPSLKRVAVITGPGLEAVIAGASEEAERHGIELLHRVVKTDKELLFEYKRMAPTIHGLWLLPDNRMLSGRAIKELMSFSVRNAKQVAVFSGAILRLGGLLSVTARPEEIADKVKQRLTAAYEGKGVPGPDLLLLEHGDIQVNSAAVKRYNLNYTENKGLRKNVKGVAQ